jgi:hypothetical protein
MKRLWLGVGGWLLSAVLLMSCGDGVQRDCSADAECTILSDCCVGCTAARIGETLPPCDVVCIQDACAATHGDASVSAICNDGTCSVLAQ